MGRFISASCFVAPEPIVSLLGFVHNGDVFAGAIVAINISLLWRKTNFTFALPT